MISFVQFISFKTGLGADSVISFVVIWFELHFSNGGRNHLFLWLCIPLKQVVIWYSWRIDSFCDQILFKFASMFTKFFSLALFRSINIEPTKSFGYNWQCFATAVWKMAVKGITLNYLNSNSDTTLLCSLLYGLFIVVRIVSVVWVNPGFIKVWLPQWF